VIDLGEMMNFGRTESVNVEIGIMTFDIGQHVFIPTEFKFWMQSALQQNLVSAEVYGLFDFLQQICTVQHVAFFVFGAAVKRAEIADGRADVGVVDVPVNVVSAVIFRVQAFGYRVGGGPEYGKVVASRQLKAFGGGQSLAGDGFVEELVDALGHLKFEVLK
jgi:hypothetical protein